MKTITLKWTSGGWVGRIDGEYNNEYLPTAYTRDAGVELVAKEICEINPSAAVVIDAASLDGYAYYRFNGLCRTV